MIYRRGGLARRRRREKDRPANGGTKTEKGGEKRASRDEEVGASVNPARSIVAN